MHCIYNLQNKGIHSVTFLLNDSHDRKLFEKYIDRNEVVPVQIEILALVSTTG